MDEKLADYPELLEIAEVEATRLAKRNGGET